MTQPDSPPLMLIIMPSKSRHHAAARAFAASAEDFPALSLTASKNSSSKLQQCYSSNDTCSDSTGCNGRGSCALLSKSGDTECWGCQCASGFAGAQCQKTDYSV